MISEGIWITKKIYDDAETSYYENVAKSSLTPLAHEVAKVRQHLIESRDNFASNVSAMSSIDTGAVKFLEKKVLEYGKSIDHILNELKALNLRVTSIESFVKSNCKSAPAAAAQKQQTAPKKAEEEDDDVDLFGSDSEEETEELKKIREDRLAAYAAKKSKKPALIAKSNIILDVKPWDDETDMKAMEEAVRKIEMDGLLWGAAKLVPLAYGIHKLQISCVVEDDKVSIDLLQEQIETLEDYVQSIDIAAFNKI